MGDWTVDGRDGVKVTAVEQMMGMFLASVYEKSKELQLILDNDPLAFEQIEQQAKELFDHGAGLFLTGLIAKSMKTPSTRNVAMPFEMAMSFPSERGRIVKFTSIWPLDSRVMQRRVTVNRNIRTKTTIRRVSISN